MSAIQGIEGVISQLQTTAMSARAQESLPQPIHKQPPARRQKNSPSVSPAWR